MTAKRERETMFQNIEFSGAKDVDVNNLMNLLGRQDVFCSSSIKFWSVTYCQEHNVVHLVHLIFDVGEVELTIYINGENVSQSMLDAINKIFKLNIFVDKSPSSFVSNLQVKHKRNISLNGSIICVNDGCKVHKTLDA